MFDSSCLRLLKDVNCLKKIFLMTVCGCLFLFTTSVNAANENDSTEGSFCSYVEMEPVEQNMLNIDDTAALQLGVPLFSCHKGTEYISMERENLNLYGSRFHNSNKKVLLFSIDGTFYKCTHDIKKHELRGYIKTFNKLKPQSEKRSMRDFYDGSDAPFFQSLYDALNVTPFKFEVEKGDMKYDEYIQRDDRLIECHSKSEYRIWCFTNALKCKAKVILNALGIEELIEGVVCTDDHSRGPVMKPYTVAYKFVENLLGVSGEYIYFLDGREVNLIIPRMLGWKTCLINLDDDLITKVEEFVN